MKMSNLAPISLTTRNRMFSPNIAYHRIVPLSLFLVAMLFLSVPQNSQAQLSSADRNRYNAYGGFFAPGYDRFGVYYASPNNRATRSFNLDSIYLNKRYTSTWNQVFPTSVPGGMPLFALLSAISCGVTVYDCSRSSCNTEFGSGVSQPKLASVRVLHGGAHEATVVVPRNKMDNLAVGFDTFRPFGPYDPTHIRYPGTGWQSSPVSDIGERFPRRGYGHNVYGSSPGLVAAGGTIQNIPASGGRVGIADFNSSGGRCAAIINIVPESPPPSCTLVASAPYYRNGQSYTRLTWSATNADSARLFQNGNRISTSLARNNLEVPLDAVRNNVFSLRGQAGSLSCRRDRSVAAPRCSDGIDNDSDGLTDELDPGCWTDIEDPGSYNPRDNSEYNPDLCAGGLLGDLTARSVSPTGPYRQSLSILSGQSVQLRATNNCTVSSRISGPNVPGNISVDAVSPFVSGAITPPLTPGTYRYSYQFTDALGNTANDTLDVVVNALPPTITLSTAPTNNSTQTIDPDTEVTVSWATTNVTSCTSSDISISGAGISGNLVGITEPTPGSSKTYSINCVGQGGTVTDSFTVTTNNYPNLRPTSMIITPSATFDPSTGNYDSVTVSGAIRNLSGSVAAPSRLRWRLNSVSAGSQTSFANINSLPVGGDSSQSHVFFNVPFGANQFSLAADIDDSVRESNEGDNAFSTTNTLPPPPPDLELTADEKLVRSGNSTTVRWNTNVTYPMDCRLSGPGVPLTQFDPSVSGATGSVLTGALDATSVYELTCNEPTSNTNFSTSTTVENLGSVEEV